MNKYEMTDTTSDINIVFKNNVRVFAGLKEECIAYIAFHESFDGICDAIYADNHPDFRLVAKGLVLICDTYWNDVLTKDEFIDYTTRLSEKYLL